VEQGYWASFNSPWFTEIFNIAGYPEKIASAGAIGSWYSYYNCSRYKIFKRDAPTVTNFDEFKGLMDQNRFANDPLSNGDPAQQPMSRYDLRPDDCIWGKRRAYGGLDVKATTILRSLAFLSFDAKGSPTHASQPPFNFAAPEWAHLNHDGLPALWNFSWVQFATEGFDRCGGARSKDDCFERAGCGWCIYDQRCLLGFADGPALGEKCQAGWVLPKKLPSWAIPVVATVASVSGVFMLAVYGGHFYRKKKLAGYDGLLGASSA
jgi:hypothetical protein